MEIADIKKALREVRNMCANTQHCADCPLKGEKWCALWDGNGEALEYPCQWPLDWGDRGAHWTECTECSECGKMALYNGNEEPVKSKFCPHCGAKMEV